MPEPLNQTGVDSANEARSSMFNALLKTVKANWFIKGIGGGDSNNPTPPTDEQVIAQANKLIDSAPAGQAYITAPNGLHIPTRKTIDEISTTIGSGAQEAEPNQFMVFIQALFKTIGKMFSGEMSQNEGGFFASFAQTFKESMAEVAGKPVKDTMEQKLQAYATTNPQHAEFFAQQKVVETTLKGVDDAVRTRIGLQEAKDATLNLAAVKIKGLDELQKLGKPPEKTGNKQIDAEAQVEYTVSTAVAHLQGLTPEELKASTAPQFERVKNAAITKGKELIQTDPDMTQNAERFSNALLNGILPEMKAIVKETVTDPTAKAQTLQKLESFKDKTVPEMVAALDADANTSSFAFALKTLDRDIRMGHTHIAAAAQGIDRSDPEFIARTQREAAESMAKTQQDLRNKVRTMVAPRVAEQVNNTATEEVKKWAWVPFTPANLKQAQERGYAPNPQQVDAIAQITASAAERVTFDPKNKGLPRREMAKLISEQVEKDLINAAPALNSGANYYLAAYQRPRDAQGEPIRLSTGQDISFGVANVDGGKRFAVDTMVQDNKGVQKPFYQVVAEGVRETLNPKDARLSADPKEKEELAKADVAAKEIYSKLQSAQQTYFGNGTGNTASLVPGEQGAPATTPTLQSRGNQRG